MFGKNLSEIVDAFNSEPQRIDSGTIPQFKYSSENSVALDWARNLEIISSDKFPIEAVLKGLGIKIHYEEMEEDFSGYIENRNRNWHIGVNKYEVTGRQRFTLAHEFGHLLFHRNIIIEGKFTEAIKLFRKQESLKKIEREANAFAADLLMPSRRFRELWRDAPPQKISELLNVSIYAIEFRAQTLSLPKKDS